MPVFKLLTSALLLLPSSADLPVKSCIFQDSSPEMLMVVESGFGLIESEDLCSSSTSKDASLNLM